MKKKLKLKTTEASIRVVCRYTIDEYLDKTYGHSYGAWHMERPYMMMGLHHVDGELSFMEDSWKNFKKTGAREGLRSGVILNGLASEGLIPKGIYFIT